jgi:hypothetical protein
MARILRERLRRRIIKQSIFREFGPKRSEIL